ncbi:MAG TPA: hypothetical protein VMS71_01510 [Candidatus Acidoferrum sp.]|nr:hypothetical protein [Candidatus Acidoferrum sp.]
MPGYLEFEAAAERLRYCLRIAPTPELQLLCGLRCFSKMRGISGVALEANVREFVPAMADLASRVDPAELLPAEVVTLAEMVGILSNLPKSLVSADDLRSFDTLRADAQAVGKQMRSAAAPRSSNDIFVTCLFVEHYPDLNLEPRGRILTLRVSATRLSQRAGEDVVVLTNPVEQPGDRFLVQARNSATAARQYVARKYGLPERQKYRFDFVVEATRARFTGDSLGLAFAVGAVAALSRVEHFRDHLSVPSDAAFSGAMSADGKLEPIDVEALKLKIHRAFVSDLKRVVIPRENISDAWQYLRALEEAAPDRKLELVDAEDLSSVADDPRLVHVERASVAMYAFRRARSTINKAHVGIPVLLVLIAILFYLMAPNAWKFWRDHNPTYFKTDLHTLQVFSADWLPLWRHTFVCDLDTLNQIVSCVAATDLNGDGKNEVLIAPRSGQACPEADSMYVYDHKGNLLFARDIVVHGEYVGDSIPVFYEAGLVRVFRIRGKPVVVTEAFAHAPARQHIKFWDDSLKQIGWYINAGSCDPRVIKDINGDGSDEFLFCAFNNRMGCSGFFVLSADSCAGVSPPYGVVDYDLTKCRRGNQLQYVLFPVTDVGQIDLSSKYNSPSNLIDNGDGTLKMVIGEGDTHEIHYVLGPDFLVRRVFANDQFTKRRNTLADKHILPAVDWDTYDRNLRDTVLHWTDSGWVTDGRLRATVKQP